MGKYSSRRTLSIELESKITIDQADILSKDKEVRDQIVEMCKRLAPMQIGQLGVLLKAFVHGADLKFV